jgi:2-keto-4-pentenoate hydratase/2-oxohepta-3-ene-1,7-dioic acid hydratase in catechol pathway
MRLITYRAEGRDSLGAWIDGDRQVVDLARAAQLAGVDAAPFASMLSLIEAGPESWAAARRLVADASGAAVHPSSDCALLAPLPRPVQIRDCLCFPDHLRGAAAMQAKQMIAASADPEKTRAEIEASGMLDLAPAYFDFPVYYISNRMAVAGPGEEIEWPAYSQTIDYEMEWAAVIGTPCRGVAAEEARPHIFGYTVFNDWSARDEQMRAMRGSGINLGPGRGKDFRNGLGPCIVTADEIDDPYDLAMTVRVNGEQVSRGSSAGMHYKFEDLIAFLSAGTTLYPGEILGSGTVGGGCSIETGQLIRPGDVIELEVERIGVLRNRVTGAHIG